MLKPSPKCEGFSFAPPRKEAMNNRVFVCGGMRIGDAFFMSHFLSKFCQKTEIDIIAGYWAIDVFRWLKAHTDLKIGDIIQFKERGLAVCMANIVEFRTEAMRELDLANRYKYIMFPTGPNCFESNKLIQHNMQPVDLPPYIAVQVKSISMFKSTLELEDVKYPLPVISLEQRFTETKLPVRLVDAPFEQVIDVIWGCKLFVGCCSALTGIAAILGKPTIMLHFEQDVIESRGVSWSPKCKDLCKVPKADLEYIIRDMIHE